MLIDNLIEKYETISTAILWSTEDFFDNKRTKGVMCKETAASFWGFNHKINEIMQISVPKGYNLNIKDSNYHFTQRTKGKYALGIVTFMFDELEYRVYSPERTIVELLKDQKEVYDDIFIETLKTFFTEFNYDYKELMKYAKMFGVYHYVKLLVAVYGDF